jgi:hypothetical protein
MLERMSTMKTMREHRHHADSISAFARCALAALLTFASAAASADTPLPVHGPATGLADSAALRETVFGVMPQDLAPMPASVPLTEIELSLPWRLPVPAVYWFDTRLQVYFSAQPKPAPLAIVIAGTGSDANTRSMGYLRAALYGAGYHVLCLPSPTFPRFIVSASRTGVAGDLSQDSADLYAAIVEIVAVLPRETKITDIDVLGYSLGGAQAAMVKAIDAREGRVHIHRAVAINPPVSLFASIGRLDKLFAQSIGPADGGIERLYQKLYARLATAYRASGETHVDSDFLLAAAAQVLHSDSEFAAAITLTFRLALTDMFFAGDIYTHAGVVTDPDHLPRVGDPLDGIWRELRAKTFADYFDKVLAPYYLKHRPGTTRASLIADNRLDVIGDALRNDADYYAQTNSDDLILDADELAWLKRTFGARIAVYDHGGHLGNLGEKQQIADMLEMLAGDWPGGAR